MSGFGWNAGGSQCNCTFPYGGGPCPHGRYSSGPTPGYVAPPTYVPPSYAPPSYAPPPYAPPSSYPAAYAPNSYPQVPQSSAPHFQIHVHGSHSSHGGHNSGHSGGRFPTQVEWKDYNLYSHIPSNAVKGGRDVDGQPIYVGRAFHEGDLIPAKVIPGRKVAYVAWNGKEHAKTSVQILVGYGFRWERSAYGRIPRSAVDGGRTSSGETLYVGRVHHKGSETVGKVHPSHGCCYISFDGGEIPFKDYEVLVH